MVNYELDKINKTVKESNIHLCQYCGKEVDRRRIFCDEHNTDLNKQIYEFFVDIPFRPRGGKLYEIFASYLGTRLGILDDRRIILKSIASAGKSFLMDLIAYIELTHFPNSEIVIGSVSDTVSKEHITRLRKWISDSLFSKYISGSRDATASKTEIHLAHLNSRVISIPQAEKTRTGWHPTLLLIDEIGRMKPDSYWGCYSADTEVLTDDGWMELKTICDNELSVRIATLNQEIDEVEYHKPTCFFKYPYTGKMFHQHSKGIIDFLVTPNHQCYVKSTYEKSIWGFRKAEDLPKHYMIDKHFPWQGKYEKYFILPSVPYGKKEKECGTKKFLMDDWLAFFGIWIAEGSAFVMRRKARNTNRYIVQIAQEDDDTRKAIKKLCEKLGYVTQDTGHELRIHNKQLCYHLKEFGHSHDKYIPKEFKNLAKSQLNLLLKWMIIGDGHKTSKSAYYYCTSSRQLADDVYEIALKAGWNLSQSRFYEQNDCCYVNLTKSHFKPELNSQKDQREWVDYDGNVYDIEIPNHMFYVRRNKKCMWGSNSFYQMGKLHAIEILASTPFSDSLVMKDVWNSDGIKQVALTPEDCWWIDKRILTQAKKDLPPNLYSQLYEAKFRTISNRVIPDDIFLESIARGAHMQQSQNLLMGVDFGQKIDPTAVIVIDLETGDIKFAMQFDDAWKIQFAKIRQIYNEWKPIKIMADSSSIGSVIISELSDLPIEGVSMHNDILKKRVIDRLTMAFINHKINIVADEFPLLISQLSSYVYLDQDHKKMGPSGRGHDDFVDALGLALMAFDVSSVSDMKQADNIWTFTRVPGSSASPWKIGGF